MASRRTGGSQIVFHGTRPVSVRSGGSKNSNITTNTQVGLAKRLLFPFQTPAIPLPPVIGTIAGVQVKDTAALKVLNDELYDFLALALRGFVLPWWSKITPRDKDFLQEITRIVAHLIQQLEARVLAADVPSLLAKNVPILITQHYVDYRTAQSKLPTSYSTGLHGNSTSLQHLFHSLQPHMAVTAEGVVDPDYIRQIIEHIMKACLPQEDWEAEAERNIVREIVLKIVINDAFPRLSQPWFLHKSLLEVLGLPNESTPQASTKPRGAFSFNTIVIFILSAVQVISGFALTVISNVQACLHIITEVNNSSQDKGKGHPPNANEDLACPTIKMFAEILSMRERGATAAILSLIQVLTGFLAPFLNRLIPYLFYANMHPSLFTKVVTQSKKVLFPNGYPGPPPVEPTSEEQVVLREQLEKSLFGIVPSTATRFLFGPDLDTQRRTVKGMLDPLNNSNCNVHLLMFLFDAIIIAIFPELALHVEGEDAEVQQDDGASPFLTPPGANHSPLSPVDNADM